MFHCLKQFGIFLLLGQYYFGVQKQIIINKSNNARAFKTYQGLIYNIKTPKQNIGFLLKPFSDKTLF